jgi:hypothetical protein
VRINSLLYFFVGGDAVGGDAPRIVSLDLREPLQEQPALTLLGRVEYIWAMGGTNAEGAWLAFALDDGVNVSFSARRVLPQLEPAWTVTMLETIRSASALAATLCAGRLAVAAQTATGPLGRVFDLT